MKSQLRIPIILLVSSFFIAHKAEKIDDSIHYYISFTSDSTFIKAPPPLEDSELSDDYVKIMSRNNERFVCKLPHIGPDEKKAIDYSGPTAGKLLETMLYKDSMCSFLIDVYWTYQVS